MQANAKFQIKNWEEQPFSEVEGAGKLTSGNFEIAYHGDLQGEGVLAQFKHHTTDGSAKIYGFERVTGRVGNKSGSFVLEHVGTFKNGMVTSKRSVIPGSGTGDLKGIRGLIHFTSGPAKEFAMAFDYYFE